MSPAEIGKLAECGQGIGFIDETDYPEGPVVYKGVRAAIPVRPTHQAVVNPLLSRISISQVWSTITSLAAYTTRYYTSNTGLQAANYLVNRYRTYGNGIPGVYVQPYSHSWLQPSIIAGITGSTYPNEIVIIGGHIDSTSNGNVAPGADDDASGSASVLEIFRVLTAAGFAPERTIEFHGYAAEEAGLRGSQAIANAYASAGYDVVSMLQLDMTGFIYPQTTPTIGVVTDFTTGTLSAFVRLLVDEYCVSLSWTNTQCGYGCSDHASWNRAGYTDAFIFESTFANSNPYIHTTSDTLNRLTQNHAADFVRVGLGYVVEMSYGE
jgi:leucyl aminopeptidase